MIIISANLRLLLILLLVSPSSIDIRRITKEKVSVNS